MSEQWPSRARSRDRWLYRLLLPVATALFRVYFRLRATGIDRFPDGPLIVVANHSSFLDPFVLQTTFPRKIAFLVTSAFYDRRRFRWFLKLMGCIPVQDGSGNRRAIDEALAVLADGGVVGIFPEGGISPDGRLKPAHSGAAAMMLRARTRLLPAYIDGLHDVFPRSAWFPRPGRVEVRYGPPLAPQSTGSEVARKKQIEHLTRELMEVLARLGGVPPPGSS